MPAPSPCRLAFAFVCAALITTGCATPPTKELSQAQGALDAARAAGAPTYAAAEFAAAEATLARAHAEVADRDYRAALGHALDSSARAQAAAAAAVEARVKAHLEADRTLDDFASLIDKTDALLATPEAKRVPAAVQRTAASAVAAALEALAQARASVAKDDLTVLQGVPAHVAALESALASLAPPPRRTRPRS